ncbi:MAG: hypothetical protein ACTS3F_05225 [Phycisphaerales bacterium]
MATRDRVLVSILSVVVFGSMGGKAGAGTGVVTQSLPFGGGLSPFVTSLVFDQVDDASVGLPPGQFLVVTNVVLSVEATMSVSATAENGLDVPNTGVGVSMGGSVSAGVGGLGVGTNFFATASSGELAASDGVPGIGADFHNFGLLSDFGVGDDIVFDGFGPFLGDGTFVVDVSASGGVAFFNDAGVTTTTSDFGIGGVVTVEIFYVSVPSAPGCALLAVGPMWLSRRRRRGGDGG